MNTAAKLFHLRKSYVFKLHPASPVELMSRRKSGRRMENNSKRQKELETVDKEHSEKQTRKEKLKKKTTAIMTNI